MNRRMEAGPQLDAVVDEQFLGGTQGSAWFDRPPAYSTDNAAALRLMESDRWPSGWVLRRPHGRRPWQVLDLEESEPVAEAATAALALCRAALAARGRQERAARPRVVREPLYRPNNRPLPSDLARVYALVPVCYRIIPCARHGGFWWRGSFGPTADLNRIEQRLRQRGFTRVERVLSAAETDLWLRPCTREEATVAER